MKCKNCNRELTEVIEQTSSALRHYYCPKCGQGLRTIPNNDATSSNPVIKYWTIGFHDGETSATGSITTK